MDAIELWKMYQQVDPEASTYEAWAFCGGGEAGDRLADLVLAGTKIATASAYQLYQLEKAPIPAVGGLSIILKTGGQAVCIIRTTEVHICRFNEVSAEHAYKEGEGDRTLDYWREVHREFFSMELEENGLSFDEDMLVVCETFELVLRAK